MDKNRPKIKSCEICNIQATCLCYECFTYFCDSCFKIIHDKTPNKEHKKQNIDLFAPIDTKCAVHPKNILSLFCTDEKGKK